MSRDGGGSACGATARVRLSCQRDHSACHPETFTNTGPAASSLSTDLKIQMLLEICSVDSSCERRFLEDVFLSAKRS
jgi:hypothetical protein